jgi:hypothetical protein
VPLAWFAVALATSQPATAEEVAFACRRIGPFPDQQIALRYQSAAAGTLVLTGALGTATLPARRSRRPGLGPQGATAIDASGPTQLPMPARDALQACLQQLKNPTADPDIALLHRLGCQAQVPLMPQPVPVVLTISIASGKVGSEVLTEATVRREPPGPQGDDNALLRIETEYTCEVVP